MKHIKKLNIDFNNWDELNGNNISGKLIDIFDLLKVGDHIVANFIKDKEYKNQHGIIRCKRKKYKYTDQTICIEFFNNINGHNCASDCPGKYGHCWFFGIDYDIYKLNILSVNDKN